MSAVTEELEVRVLHATTMWAEYLKLTVQAWDVKDHTEAWWPETFAGFREGLQRKYDHLCTLEAMLQTAKKYLTEVPDAEHSYRLARQAQDDLGTWEGIYPYGHLDLRGNPPSDFNMYWWTAITREAWDWNREQNHWPKGKVPQRYTNLVKTGDPTKEHL